MVWACSLRHRAQDVVKGDVKLVVGDFMHLTQVVYTSAVLESVPFPLFHHCRGAGLFVIITLTNCTPHLLTFSSVLMFHTVCCFHMWAFQLNLSSMVIPRYGWSWTVGRSMLFRVYLWQMGLLFFCDVQDEAFPGIEFNLPGFCPQF